MQLHIPPTDNLSLESNLERLALEAEFIDNLISNFQETLPKLSSLMMDVSAGLTSDIDKKALKEMKAFQLGNRNKLKELTMSDIGGSLVQVPANFNGNLNQYIPDLTDICSDTFDMGKDVLTEYGLLLSSFITNKEDKTSLSDKTKTYKELTTARLSFVDRLESYRSKASRSDKVSLDSVIYRVNDIADLTKITIDLLAVLAKQDIRSLNDEVRKISELLDIIKKSADEKNLSRVSGPAAKNVAESAYNLAKFVELIAVVRHRAEEVLLSVKDINKVVKKI